MVILCSECSLQLSMHHNCVERRRKFVASHDHKSRSTDIAAHSYSAMSSPKSTLQVYESDKPARNKKAKKERKHMTSKSNGNQQNYAGHETRL